MLFNTNSIDTKDYRVYGSAYFYRSIHDTVSQGPIDICIFPAWSLWHSNFKFVHDCLEVESKETGDFFFNMRFLFFTHGAVHKGCRQCRGGEGSKIVQKLPTNGSKKVLTWGRGVSNIPKKCRRLLWTVHHSVLEQIWIKGSYLSQWLPQGQRGPPKESKSRWI